MLQHCYERALLVLDSDSLFVATCDEEIMEHVAEFGGNSILTSADHETATGRAAEAISIIETRDQIAVTEIVMIQGDEPLFPPTALNQIIGQLQDESTEVVGLMSPSKSESEINSEDNVKVVASVSDHALYFSRKPIPSHYRTTSSLRAYIQNGIFGFKRHRLEWFLRTPQTPLELLESIDMLRFIEYGLPVHMVNSLSHMIGVDTRTDLELAEALLREDVTTFKYL
jgi:3-deoxy-manno-octulosonate cytidylyltransferase (CMP-KDO synthetase)